MLKKISVLKAFILLLAAGVYFVGCPSSNSFGAGSPPNPIIPIDIDLNIFGQEMLRADNWYSLMDNPGPYVSNFTDPALGESLQIDYRNQNYFIYPIEPTDFSAYDEISFKMKSDGTDGVAVFLLELSDGAWRLWS